MTTILIGLNFGFFWCGGIIIYEGSEMKFLVKTKDRCEQPRPKINENFSPAIYFAISVTALVKIFGLGE